MSRLRPSGRAWLCAVALGAAGCSTPAVDDLADASSGMTEGLVLVEGDVSSEAGAQASVSAKFMRLSASVEAPEAERVVNTRLQQPAVGACMPLSNGSEAPQLSDKASIELLDVGDLSVRVGRAAPVALAARAFPDVGEIVSGVFYTTRDNEPGLGSGTYVVEASGSAQVDRFDVRADAPEALEDVRVGDELLTEGLTLEGGMPAALRWRAPDGSTVGEDRILVDLTSAGQTVRCAFADVGAGTLPAEVLDEHALNAEGGLAIEVHRVRRVFFGTSTIDAGEVRFDVSVVGRAAVARTE